LESILECLKIVSPEIPIKILELKIISENHEKTYEILSSFNSVFGTILQVYKQIHHRRIQAQSWKVSLITPFDGTWKIHSILLYGYWAWKINGQFLRILNLKSVKNNLKLAKQKSPSR
jgi:hypothetical protein